MLDARRKAELDAHILEVINKQIVPMLDRLRYSIQQKVVAEVTQKLKHDTLDNLAYQFFQFQDQARHFGVRASATEARLSALEAKLNDKT